MMRSALKRLTESLVVVVLVSFLVFLLIQMVPGGAAHAILGENQASPDRVEELEKSLGLDRPIVVQFAGWLGDAVRGDLGTSVLTGRSFTSSFVEAAPATLSIAILAITVAIVLGGAAGLVSGFAQGSLIDRVVSVFATLGISMPGFWIGMLLVTAFSLTLGWFPATGYVPISQGVVPWVQHAILPAVALGVAASAEIARQTRSSVIDVLHQPYIRSARSKGVGTGRLVRLHVIRNASIPVVTVIGLQVAHLLGASIVVEQVFGIPGLGTMAVNAVLGRDYPIIQGYVVVLAVVVVVCNLVVDSSYGLLSPKVRS